MDRQDEQDMTQTDALPSVAGRILECSLGVFERRCLVLIMEEQQKAWVENHIVAVLCDAVRLCREHIDHINKPLKIHSLTLMKIADLVKDGLAVEGAHHKQFFLEQIAAELGVDFRQIRADSGIKHGVAP